jgi:hypothetical protein
VLPIPFDRWTRTDDHAFETIRRRHCGERRQDVVVLRGDDDLPPEERDSANLRVSIDVDVERGARADGTIAGD